MSDQPTKPAADRGNPAVHTPRLAHALSALHNDVNHLFRRFLAGSPLPASAGTAHSAWYDWGFPIPAVDMTEDDKALRVAIELPGVAIDDVQLSLSGETLTIKGEKKEETAEKTQAVHIFERSYGAFQRSFHVPDNVDRPNVSAKFDVPVRPRPPSAGLSDLV
ncbi:MAG: Hsp20/alpha crystallin family protein [Aliidongia sp.]